MSLFGTLDYKDYLRTHIEKNADEYGYKSKLADAGGFQKSFLSQVLNSHVHFTPEHALRLAQFWDLSSKEREYFLELVHYGRAGSPELSQYLREKLLKLKKESEHLGKRFAQPALAVPEDLAAIYYSSWHYSAIHILITIPQFRTVARIAKRLSLSEAIIKTSLKQLQSLELVEKDAQDNWKATNKSLHIPKDSIFNTINNNNWRQRSQTDSQQLNTQSIHYTGIYSLSVTDFERLREITFELIDKSRQMVIASPEEELVCFTCDLFSV